MTNQNKHLIAFFENLYSKSFPTVTKSLTILFPQYSRAIDGPESALKPWSKE